MSTALDNSWLYIDGALINEAGTEYVAFAIEGEYYHGVEGGESWTEGSQRASCVVGSIPPGKYILRLNPQWEKAVGRYDITVRSHVPRPLHLVLAVLLVGLWPALLVLQRAAFEGRRWSESDYSG